MLGFDVGGLSGLLFGLLMGYSFLKKSSKRYIGSPCSGVPSSRMCRLDFSMDEDGFFSDRSS
jgi:hypothetical protein